MPIKMTKSQREAAKHYFKLKDFRYYPDGSLRPALQVWQSAVRHVFFRERLSESVKLDKKRSKRAKAGWKTRRANQKLFA